MIKLDLEEINLPVVPLGIPSEVRFNISNSGNDKIKIDYTLPKDRAHIPLDIEFPSGNILGLGRNTIPVIVSFVTDIPLCFTCQIIFHCGDGSRYPIWTRAVSDSCLLSVWPWLGRHRYALQTEPGHGLTCVDLGTRASNNQLETNPPANTLIKFLQALNLINIDSEAFPQALIDTNGELIFRLVESLTGKTLNRRTGKSNTEDPADPGPSAQYEKLLQFLLSNGALLTTRHEYLVASSTFIANLSTEQQADHQNHGRLHSALSRQAWFELLCQIVKVFILERVTKRTVSEAANGVDTNVCRSNIFSEPEILLLSWLQYHRCDKDAEPLMNFDSDLRDGVALADVLSTYFPHITQLSNLDRHADGNEEKMISNAEKIISAMQQANLQMTISVSFIVSPNPRDMLLLVLYLFFTLPSYVPRSTLTFKGRVNDSIVKNVGIKNPNPFDVGYDIRIDGCKDFQTATSISIEPHKSMDLPISLCSRFMKTEEAMLWILPRRLSREHVLKPLPKPIVFRLKTSLSQPAAQSTVTVKAKLYELQQFVVEIKNVFDSDGSFSIDCSQQQNTKQMTLFSSAPDKDSPCFPSAFSTDKKLITIKKGAIEKLICWFRPFFEAEFHCHMKLIDPEIGEMSIDFKGETDPPNIIGEVLRVNCKETSAVFVKDIVLAPFNANLDRALAHASGDHKSKQDPSTRSRLLPSPLTYSTQCNSSFISLPPSITVVDRQSMPSGKIKFDEKGHGEGEGFKRADNLENVLRLQFRGSTPGVYPVEITLRSEYDTRIYMLEFTVQSDALKATLEFECAAGQSVKQLIPLTNNTDSEWRINAEITNNYWSCQPSLTVPRKSTVDYPLTFSPSWICEDQGILVLTNPTTKDTFTFTLKGSAKEPLCAGRVNIECQAGDVKEQTIMVENKTNENSLYRVESDLPYIHGDSSISVPAKSKREYRLRIAPGLSGQYSGLITLITNDGRYQWFSVKMIVTPAPPASTLQVESALRKAVTIDIELENPLDRQVTFKVGTQGEYLTCDRQVTLEANQSIKFSVLYAPLAIGSSSGEIRFVNEEIGEIWHELHLNCIAPERIQLEKFICAAGSQTSFEVVFTNPINAPLHIQAYSSQPSVFTVKPSAFRLASYQSHPVQIIYTPSSINQMQSAEIRFISDLAGDWMYDVVGIGTEPTSMPTLYLSSPIGQRLSHMVQFRNPFDHPIHVRLSLNQHNVDAFHLYMKKESCRVPAQSTMQIPFYFLPSGLRRCSAEIQVQADKSLKWIFPIIAEAEITSSEVFEFTCPSRSVLERSVVLRLPHLTESEIDCNTFNFKLEHSKLLDGTDVQSIFSQSVEFAEDQEKPYFDEQGSSMLFHLKFQPFRSFQAVTNMVISKSTGGRWSFKMKFQATEAVADDIIRIAAELHQTSRVSFRLCNILDRPSPFEAFFSTESSCHLSVEPSTGFLPARDLAGQQFIVSFVCIEYGKAVNGKLIIRTPEMEWIYNVKGMHPHYKFGGITSRAATTFSPFLDHETLRSLRNANTKNKNFLETNILATSSKTKRKPANKAK